VTAALKLGIVHADLSEFNIIIAPSGPCFIDWKIPKLLLTLSWTR